MGHNRVCFPKPQPCLTRQLVASMWSFFRATHHQPLIPMLTGCFFRFHSFHTSTTSLIYRLCSGASSRRLLSTSDPTFNRGPTMCSNNYEHYDVATNKCFRYVYITPAIVWGEWHLFPWVAVAQVVLLIRHFHGYFRFHYSLYRTDVHARGRDT